MNEALVEALRRYAARYPLESDAGDCLHFLQSATRPFDRAQLDGHFTGSAWLVSADGERVLLTHHRKLQRWLQLGGHADGDSDLAAVALREAEEESGLRGLSVEQTIFDVDRHRIPARGDEPEHWHYDVRFVVHAGADENFVVGEESLDLAWRRIADFGDVSSPSLRRMARKWLVRHTYQYMLQEPS